MAQLCGIVFISLGISFALIVCFQKYRKRQWIGLAEIALLEHKSFALFFSRVYGTYRERPILVDVTMTRVNMSWTPYFRVRLPIRELQGFHFKASRRKGFDSLTKMLQLPANMATSLNLPKRYLLELKPQRFASTFLNPDSPFKYLLEQKEAHLLQVKNNELCFIKLGVNHSKDKMIAIVNKLVDCVEFCEQIVENELSPRFVQRDLPLVDQYLKVAQVNDEYKSLEMQKSARQTLPLVLLLLLPFICLAFFLLVMLFEIFL